MGVGGLRAPDHPRSRGVYVNYGLVDGAGRGSSPLARGLLADRASFGASGGIIPARAGFTRHPPRHRRRARDHPRSRGVYPSTDLLWASPEGSSPLARGLPQPPGAQLGCLRIIPARAGFTPRGPPPAAPRRDHPRSRGVYNPNATWYVCELGSSPLARGLRPARQWPPPLSRIIPARAGFTRAPGRRRRRPWDHPRSRGVYSRTRATPKTPLGSSPLARGLRPGRRGRGVSGRIIPARAGFTPEAQKTVMEVPDHPRSRGVYAGLPHAPKGYPGSSPLARGLRYPRACPCAQSRIIPARAGFTAPRCPGRSLPFGSSPLARGLPLTQKGKVMTTRIIPARAGFTSPSFADPGPPRDHPRSRGVYGVTARSDQTRAGSSPLARGLHRGGVMDMTRTRIIPARAGFTRLRGRRRRAVRDHPRSRGVYNSGLMVRILIGGSSPLARGLRGERG